MPEAAVSLSLSPGPLLIRRVYRGYLAARPPKTKPVFPGGAGAATQALEIRHRRGIF